MSLEVFPTFDALDVKILREEIWSTHAMQSASGKELRASYWSEPRYRFTVAINVLRLDLTDFVLDELGQYAEFFTRHRGALKTFILEDPVDGTEREVRYSKDNLEIERLFPTSSDGRPIWMGAPVEFISEK